MNTSPLNLTSGYSLPRWNGTNAFRPMTYNEVLNAKGVIQVIGNSGKVLDVRITSKTWKRPAGTMAVGVKFGLCDLGQIRFVDHVQTFGNMPIVAL